MRWVLLLGLIGYSLASISVLTAASHAASPRPDQARDRVHERKWIHELFQQVRGPKFDVTGCPKIPPHAWLKLLLTREPIVQSLKFGPGCDVQGTFKISQTPFPVDLAVRNLPEVSRVTAVVAITFTPNLMEQEALLDADLSRGHAYGADGGAEKELLTYTAQYGVTLGLDGRLKRNRGGKLRTSLYHGLSRPVVEPLLFEVRPADAVSVPPPSPVNTSEPAGDEYVPPAAGRPQ